jgi:5,10-methylenetetrahydromethanopterin reductase
VTEYVRVLRALLRGGQADWEGGVVQMLHPEGFGARRPIEVPFVIAAAGPKGIAAAHAVGDGVFGAPIPIPGFDWSVVLTFGTVLAEGEDPASPRVLAAAGHAAPVLFHWALENRRLDVLPNGEAWAAAYADVPPRVRHLALHDRHLVAVNGRDRPFVTGPFLREQQLALTRSEWRERLAMLEQAGATEIAYQPAGPEIVKELEAFAGAAR